MRKKRDPLRSVAGLVSLFIGIGMGTAVFMPGLAILLTLLFVGAGIYMLLTNV